MGLRVLSTYRTVNLIDKICVLCCNVVGDFILLKRLFLIAAVFCSLCVCAFGQEPALNSAQEDKKPKESTAVPLKLVFHNAGKNILRSITYNYGLNFIGAGFGTWALIETGFDWKLRTLAYENEKLVYSGIVPYYTGYFLPILVSPVFYMTGRFLKNEKLQITGLALAQAVAMSFGIHILLKIPTGRPSPGIMDSPEESKIYRPNDFSREFNGFNINVLDGWPSGHAATAAAAAATISEIYHNSLAIKIVSYTYAVLLSFGVAVTCHWASDVWAGALIGYAVGKTVGRSFRKLLEKDDTPDKITLFVTNNSLGVIVRF